jgi:glycosyltransferase involved in cell wall biosynthesis
LGWVDAALKSEILESASIFVLPSYFEGLPMSLLEAMSAALPIVASAVGGIPEAITDGVEGYLVTPGDVEGLRGAIKKLLLDADRCKSMGCRARMRFNAKFDIKVVLPMIEALYRDMGVVPRVAYCVR